MKIFRLVWFIICFSMMLSCHVYAYIDPSVMTYTIQVVAGVVVAVSAVVGVYWRKAKRKVQEKFGISADTNKEFEDDIVEFDIDD